MMLSFALRAAAAFEKIQYVFRLKTISKLRLEGSVLNLIRTFTKKKKKNPTSNNINSGKRLDAFP